jgi:uncharacterized protein (DUF1684 family)
MRRWKTAATSLADGGRAGRAPALLLIIAAACGSKPPVDEASYVASIAAARGAKDADFANSSESPVPVNKKPEFLPLAYFPIDPAYSVPAMLEQTADRTIIEMPTSVGAQRKMRKVGTLQFSLKGQPLKLSAFIEVGSANVDHLFVPFTDLTSGTETYPAGRYLDLDRNASGVYIIDFNRAYHPYCYYNPTFDCPYPPAENRLNVPVRAGERNKKK